MTTPARRAALDPLLNWMAERILEQLLAEAATDSQTQHHDRSHLHPLQHRPPARDLPR